MSIIYFDNAASAKPCKAAVDAFNYCVRANWSNPSALHKGGIEAEKIITSARKSILAKLPSTPDCKLIFTSGGTESNSLALLGLKPAVYIRPRGERNIITTWVEHPSVLQVMRGFVTAGEEVTYLYPEKGKSFEDEIIKWLNMKTYLISVMAVNNETGFAIDTEKIYKAVRKYAPYCIMHVDATQGFLRTPVNGDLISISAHKIHGFKGVGALYVKGKRDINLKSLFVGGGQQYGLRPGTEPVELIAAFGAAVDNFRYDHEHLTQLSSRLQQLLSDTNIVINSWGNLPNIVNFSVRDQNKKPIKSEIMLNYLAEKDIYVSSGSACARGQKSAALSGFRVSDSGIDSAIRVSFSDENTVAEVERFVEVLKMGIERFGT
ncbi:MAG: aminotransferase class V-fold PLP-dependent enzyme [Oscillospiraceae bacterium]|nr:aminotransferase class V-fold PLP-dependent enzyme [Oscillospiraceae bacterium]